MEMIKVSAEQFENLITRVTTLEQQVEALTKPKSSDVKEMTDADALSILNGEFKDLKHNDCAKKTGLSYGQIYSCRLQYTFKHIHKKLKDEGFQNPWVK